MSMKVIRFNFEISVKSYEDRFRLDELLETRLNDVVAAGGTIVSVQSSSIKESYNWDESATDKWLFTQHHRIIADLPVGHPYR